MKENIIGAIAVVALLVGIFAVASLPHLKKVAQGQFGASGIVGNLLAEQYDPYVQYNQGYNSAKDMTISGNSIFASTTITSLFVGYTGTALTRVNSGQCYFAPSATTIAATSSLSVDCQATAAVGLSGQSALVGVTAGDSIQLTLSTSTASTSINGYAGSLVVVGASASSTSGYITAKLENLSGTTFTWFLTGTASGTASYIATKP